MVADLFAPGAVQTRRMLRLYHLYRLTIGIALVLLISSEMDAKLLDVANGELFRIGSWTYLILNILVVVLGTVRSPAQVFSLALADVLLLAGLFYAGGGTASGIGNLMVASVAMSNVLLRGRIGLLIAAVATIAIVYLSFYLNYLHLAHTTDYVQAGTLGVLCFAVSFVVQALCRLLITSETLAEQRAHDVNNLEELNSVILQRMRTGIMVLDGDLNVQLVNQGAAKLLGHDGLTGEPIASHAPELIERLEQWQTNPTLRLKSLKLKPTGPAVQVSFIALRVREQTQTLIFLEDLSQIAQQAQQLKLAALGRLTAGIAHEIRNPLGAISHAGQLLHESEELSEPDHRLTQIIQDQCKRMNLIIENVLQLSRRRQAEPEMLDLAQWLERFVGDFRASAQGRQHLHMYVTDGPLETRMDPHHLTQVLDNLVQNGLRYSGQQNGQAQVWLNLFVEQSNGLPILEVLDDGPGFPKDQLQHIFEPFFTTEVKGTGLGLYISRELCESNQAHLDYRPRENGGSCMRITFAHPRRLS